MTELYLGFQSNSRKIFFVKKWIAESLGINYTKELTKIKRHSIILL